MTVLALYFTQYIIHIQTASSSFKNKEKSEGTSQNIFFLQINFIGQDITKPCITKNVPPKLFVHDVIECATKKKHNNQWDHFLEKHPEIEQLMEKTKLESFERNGSTVTDATGIIKMLMLLAMKDDQVMLYLLSKEFSNLLNVLQMSHTSRLTIQLPSNLANLKASFQKKNPHLLLMYLKDFEKYNNGPTITGILDEKGKTTVMQYQCNFCAHQQYSNENDFTLGFSLWIPTRIFNKTRNSAISLKE